MNNHTANLPVTTQSSFVPDYKEYFSHDSLSAQDICWLYLGVKPEDAYRLDGNRGDGGNYSFPNSNNAFSYYVGNELKNDKLGLVEKHTSLVEFIQFRNVLYPYYPTLYEFNKPELWIKNEVKY